MAYIFSSSLMEDDQTVQNWKRVESGNQKYGGSWKNGSSVFRHRSRVSIFVLSPQLGSAHEIGVLTRHQPRGTGEDVVFQPSPARP